MFSTIRLAIVIIVVGMIGTSCSEKTFQIEDYSTDKQKFIRRLIQSDDLDFTIAVPEKWVVKIKPATGKNYINSSIDITSWIVKNSFVDVLTIEKIPNSTRTNSLNQEFERIQSELIAKDESYTNTIIKSTSIFERETLYIENIVPNNSGAKTTIIHGLFSADDGNFYRLKMQTLYDENQAANLIVLTKTAMSFKLK